MNKITDETNLLRSHYYISKTEYDKYCVPITFNGKTSYIIKEFRGFKNEKFTHVNFISLFRVLGFSFMNFTFDNFDEIMENTLKYIQTFNSTSRQIESQQVGYNCLNEKNELQPNAYIDFIEDIDKIRYEDVIDRNIWPFGVPQISENENTMYNYENEDTIDFCEFINYINKIFKSNIATILQNPINFVYEEINYKFTMYKLFKNKKLLAFDLLPSIYDYLIAQSILDYIELCHFKT